MDALIDISASNDAIAYGRKAHRLHVLLQAATGNDILSFPRIVHERLEILARTAAILGLDDATRSTYSAALSKLSSDQRQVQLQLIQLKNVEQEFRASIALARHRQRVVTSWKTTIEEPGNDTTSLELNKKSMATKAKEYQQELIALTSENPLEEDEGPSVTSLITLLETLRRKERVLRTQKSRLRAFEGLPPNLELAKLELAKARENQIRLMNTREKLLGRMTIA